MANRTIQSKDLTPNATYLVRGKVGFSRITRHTTDEERDKENSRRKYKIDKNYSNITIYNATVLAKDANNPTVEERYAAENMYMSSSQNYPGNNFSALNKTKNLPVIGVLSPTPEVPNNYVEIIPEAELAPGLDVTLVMRVYNGQGDNNGVSLDRILVNEPIRYYGGNTEVDKTLSSFGITFQAMAPDEKNTAATSEATANNAGQSAQPAMATNNAFATMNNAQPATNAQPDANNGIAPAAGNPFSSYDGQANIQFGPGTRQY